MLIKRAKPFLLLTLIAGLLSSPLALNADLYVASDALIHTGIAYAIQRDGIPPLNPFLAGEKLPYYWFYNALAAGGSSLLGLEPFAIMALLNPLALLTLLVAVYLIIGRMSRDRSEDGPGLLGAVWVAFGLNGWGSFFLISTLRGNIFSLGPILSGGVWAYLPRIVISQWEGTMGFMATKFLVANSFAPSLASLALAILFLFAFLDRPRIVTGFAFWSCMLLTTYLNSVTGGALIVVCLIFFIQWFVFPLPQQREHRRLALCGLLSIALALAAALPYHASIIGAADTLERAVRFQYPDWFHIRVLIVILLPLWVTAGIAWIAGGRRPCTPPILFSLVSIILLSAAFLCLRFSRHNEFKLPFLLAIFLSLTLGDHYRRLPRRAKPIVWIITLSIFPTTLLGLVAYRRAPPQFSISPPEAAAYAWMRDNLPPDAVVVAPRSLDAIPLLVRRDAYVACRPFLRSIPASRDLINQRKATAAALRDDNLVGEILKKIAVEVGRPVVLIADPGQAITADGILRIYSAGGIDLWSLPAVSAAKRRE